MIALIGLSSITFLTFSEILSNAGKCGIVIIGRNFPRVECHEIG